MSIEALVANARGKAGNTRTPRISGLEQIANDVIKFLLVTAPAPFSTQDDAASQPGTISSQQTPFHPYSSQQTVLGSRQQKPSCEGSNATKATIPADASLEAPGSNLELVELLLVRSGRSIQESASFSGQATALEHVEIAVELPRLLPIFGQQELFDQAGLSGIILRCTYLLSLTILPLLIVPNLSSQL